MNSVTNSSKDNNTETNGIYTNSDEPQITAPAIVALKNRRGGSFGFGGEKESDDTVTQPSAPKTIGFYGMWNLLKRFLRFLDPFRFGYPRF
jgi:hypothetical protein